MNPCAGVYSDVISELPNWSCRRKSTITMGYAAWGNGAPRAPNPKLLSVGGLPPTPPNPESGTHEIPIFSQVIMTAASGVGIVLPDT